MGGEFIDAGLGVLQSSESRKLQEQRHSDGEDGEQSDAAQILKEPPEALETTNLIADKQKEYENAYKQTNIIVCSNRKSQADGVQNEFLVLQQGNSAQGNQRKHSKAIHPHDIPAVPQTPGAQTVKCTKKSNGKIILIKKLFQENRKEQAGKAQLNGSQEGEILQGVICGNKDAE